VAAAAKRVSVGNAARSMTPSVLLAFALLFTTIVEQLVCTSALADV
jgi:hypothetical protein